MINRVVLVGRLTKDVEVRKTPANISVANFTVACNRRYSRQNEQSSNNQVESNADFISCVAWRNTADFLGQYAQKGALVGVEGSIQTRNYVANDGHRVYVTEVLADNVQLLSSRRDNQTQNSYQNSYESAANNYTANYTAPASNNYSSDSSDDLSSVSSLDISNDDLPFY